MNQKSHFWAVVLALVAVVIATTVAALVYMGANGTGPMAGASTPGTRFPHGITIGLPTSSPTNVSKVLVGTGAIIGNKSQTASTTSAYDIAVTGVVSGDIVFVQSATSTAAALPFIITGASASTTAGYITLTVFNLGPAAAVPNAIASSTQYEVISVQ